MKRAKIRRVHRLESGSQLEPLFKPQNTERIQFLYSEVQTIFYKKLSCQSHFKNPIVLINVDLT